MQVPCQINITAEIQQCIANSEVSSGLVNLFLQHTSASLIVSENADPDVLADLQTFMAELVDRQYPWQHKAEGADDMPAHIRSVLTQTSLSLPFDAGRLLLGTWQAVYLWEHRDQGHQRNLILTFLS